MDTKQQNATQQNQQKTAQQPNQPNNNQSDKLNKQILQQQASKRQEQVQAQKQVVRVEYNNDQQMTQQQQGKQGYYGMQDDDHYKLEEPREQIQCERGDNLDKEEVEMQKQEQYDMNDDYNQNQGVNEDNNYQYADQYDRYDRYDQSNNQQSQAGVLKLQSRQTEQERYNQEQESYNYDEQQKHHHPVSNENMKEQNNEESVLKLQSRQTQQEKQAQQKQENIAKQQAVDTGEKNQGEQQQFDQNVEQKVKSDEKQDQKEETRIGEGIVKHEDKKEQVFQKVDQVLVKAQNIKQQEIGQNQQKKDKEKKKKKKKKEKQRQLQKQRQMKREREQEQKRQKQLLILRQKQKEEQRQKQREKERQKQAQIQKKKEKQAQKEKEKRQKKKKKKKQDKNIIIVGENNETTGQNIQELEQKVQKDRSSNKKIQQKQQQVQNKENKEKQIKKQKKVKQVREEKLLVASKLPNQNNDPKKQPVNNKVEQVDAPQNIKSEVKAENTEPEITPTMIIKEAQKQRISGSLALFLQYEKVHKKHTQSQKTVINSVFGEIQNRRKQKYGIYHVIKEYFLAYSNLSKEFHEKSYKIRKSQRNPEKNIYINMQQQLEGGLQQLSFLRKQTGNQYKRLHDFITSKVIHELENTFNLYIFQMNKVQATFENHRKQCQKFEDRYRKFAWKLQKVYQRGKQGKQQDQDVFVETCKFIQLDRKFKQQLIQWGRRLIQVRKVMITQDQRLANQIQVLLNNFKNHINTVYNIHKQKYNKIIPSLQQIKSQTKFSKLCALADIDYIKYALQISTKRDLSEISDKDFEYMLGVPHLEILTGNPVQLLKGMISKLFNLKNQNEQLINTVSGNLIVFNRSKVEYSQKFCIKNIQAQIIAEGIVQIDQVLPGIIFDSSRTVRLEFKDEDRAQELICFLNEKI